MRQKTFLNDVAVEALIEDMPEFITLLIDNGLDLDKFVTFERLEKLYQRVRFSVNWICYHHYYYIYN